MYRMNCDNGLILAYSLKGDYNMHTTQCTLSLAIFPANIMRRPGTSKTTHTFVSNIIGRNVKLTPCPFMHQLIRPDKIVAVRPVKLYCQMESDDAPCGHRKIKLLLRNSTLEHLQWEPKSILCANLCDFARNAHFYIVNYICEIDRSRVLVSEEKSRLQVNIIDPHVSYHGTSCLHCVRCRRCIVLRREHDDPKRTCKKHNNCIVPRTCTCGPYVPKPKSSFRSYFKSRKRNTTFF